MLSDNVNYIHCEKYIFNYAVRDMMSRFPFHEFNNIEHGRLRSYLVKYDEKYCRPQLPRKTFVISSVKLLGLIHEFIYGR